MTAWKLLDVASACSRKNQKKGNLHCLENIYIKIIDLYIKILYIYREK